LGQKRTIAKATDYSCNESHQDRHFSILVEFRFDSRARRDMEPTYQSTNYGGNAPWNYQQFFVPNIGGPLAEDLLAVAHLKHGEHVLDVACGTGVVTRMAAERVAPKGKVTGLDLNPGMLEVARSSTPENLTIEWIEADAEATPLEDGAFDVVFCQMGLQFVPNKLAALREMHRALTPGGRIYINLPGPKPRVFDIMMDAISRHMGQEGAAFIDLVFSMHEANELRDLFEKTGFRDIKIDAKPKRLIVSPSREFLWQYIHSTPLAQQATNADEQARRDLERDVCGKWEEFVVGDGIQFDVGMTTVCAVR
jgi:ubiquinone/menaquinone biosynthesis C-methylase UbiE